MPSLIAPAQLANESCLVRVSDPGAFQYVDGGDVGSDPVAERRQKVLERFQADRGHRNSVWLPISQPMYHAYPTHRSTWLSATYVSRKHASDASFLCALTSAKAHTYASFLTTGRRMCMACIRLVSVRSLRFVRANDSGHVNSAQLQLTRHGSLHTSSWSRTAKQSFVTAVNRQGVRVVYLCALDHEDDFDPCREVAGRQHSTGWLDIKRTSLLHAALVVL